MKKYFVIAAIVICMVFAVSCSTSAKVSNNALPKEYATLEFFNGGASIAKYENVSMAIVMMQSQTLFNSVSFYQYHIFDKKQGIDEYIIDSEALAIKYTLDTL